MPGDIRYKSTRGKQSGLTFEQVVLGGLATDKGLYIPESIPQFTLDEIEKVLTYSLGELNMKCHDCINSYFYPSS